jgi:hypothetical protein
MRSTRDKPTPRTFPGLLFVVAFVLAGCGQLLLSQATPTAWDSPLPPSGKGYELYSWPAEQGDEWRFTLITGTNRLKTYEEIVSGKDVASKSGWVQVSVEGTESLKALLGQLPRDEIVTWISEDWLEQVGVPAGSIRLPDKDVLSEIEGCCSRLGLELTVTRVTTRTEP